MAAGGNYCNPIVTTLGEIELEDGVTFTGRRDYGKGSMSNPMSDPEVIAKFMDCCAYSGWQEDRSKDIVELVTGLENLTDVGQLAASLRL